MKILVIIPAYNEEATIKNVIQRIKLKMPQADILVVNDGSKDNTSGKQNSRSQSNRLAYNLGIGGAMQTGYLYAKETDMILPFRWMGRATRPFLYKGADWAHHKQFGRCGCRSATSAKPITSHRYLEEWEWFFLIFVSTLTNQKFKDTTSVSGCKQRSHKLFFQPLSVDYPKLTYW